MGTTWVLAMAENGNCMGDGNGIEWKLYGCWLWQEWELQGLQRCWPWQRMGTVLKLAAVGLGFFMLRETITFSVFNSAMMWCKTVVANLHERKQLSSFAK